MFCFLVAALLTIASTCTASIQKPVITPCSATHIVVISDLTIINATVGQTMVIQYSGQLKEDQDSTSTIRLTITKARSGIKIPCVADVGSCEYQLCGGTSDIEKEFGAAWNNTCPILAGTYTSSASFFLPQIIAPLIGDGKLNIKIQVLKAGNVIECEQGSVTIGI